MVTRGFANGLLALRVFDCAGGVSFAKFFRGFTAAYDIVLTRGFATGYYLFASSTRMVRGLRNPEGRQCSIGAPPRERRRR